MLNWIATLLITAMLLTAGASAQVFTSSALEATPSSPSISIPAPSAAGKPAAYTPLRASQAEVNALYSHDR